MDWFLWFDILHGMRKLNQEVSILLLPVLPSFTVKDHFAISHHLLTPLFILNLKLGRKYLAEMFYLTSLYFIESILAFMHICFMYKILNTLYMTNT